ncbi:MAG: hypothetical protein KF787_08490 [Phycisphaeraceae bacterium]|nr:hypothetical protein [Phycisphaerae bacterium]MBX3392673.1 hypothetical protein [Phycisphaeraceae bacterium]HRJ50728.1 hypothetical protein [Phycisphaerales bacterium]
MNPVGVEHTGLAERIVSDSDNVQMLLAFGIVVFVTAIVVAGRTIRAVARERTKREIAAYIAEGAMTPEQGDRLIKSEAREQT